MSLLESFPDFNKYDQNVLGKYVFIRRNVFDHDERGLPVFHRGYIQDFKVSLYQTDDGPCPFYWHVVVFDDDSTEEYMLVNLEEENRLHWSPDAFDTPQVLPYSVSPPTVRPSFQAFVNSH